MSIFETKLARFQELQGRNKAREEKKLMSKSHQREIAKRLKQEIAACTDPAQLIKLTNAYVKVAPKKQRRARKLVERPKNNLPILDGKQLAHHLVLQIEAKCKGRGGWLKLSRADKDILLEAAKATLSERDRATLEEYAAGLSPEVV